MAFLFFSWDGSLPVLHTTSTMTPMSIVKVTVSFWRLTAAPQILVFTFVI
ncbi:hypothetical protein Plhal304r1_c039g0117121 [Plasmopara halstedii]